MWSEDAPTSHTRNVIRRLYVDNFRSLVDFTWEPGKETLVLGYNGSGKTSALDALNVLMNWVWGWDKFEDVLHVWDRTQWVGDAPITFECVIVADEVRYTYRASFDFSPSDDTPIIRAESLWANDSLALERKGSDVYYWDEEAGQPWFPFPRNQSALRAVSSLAEGGVVSNFEKAFYEIVLVRPVPSLMRDVAEGMPEDILPTMANFVGWHYRNTILLERFKESVEEFLREVWEELDRIDFEKVGRDARVLKVIFNGNSPLGRIVVDFRNLSDGERMLLALYSLAAYQRVSKPTTLIIDEPDNFVSLLELQPWLIAMLNERPDEGQLILVSHNPEIIQTMGHERVDYFSREDHASPTKVSKLPPDDGGLPLTELLARGWVDV